MKIHIIIEILLVIIVGLVLCPSTEAARPNKKLSKFVRAGTPLVMVVFDEFPVSTLLDGNDQIDAVRFPNFARLAAESYWFRNATSVNQFTSLAVPSLMSGRLPSSVKRRPVALAYPRTIFTLLGKKYEMNVHEPYTKLCPGRLCAKGRRTARFRAIQNAIDRKAAKKSKGWSGVSNVSEDRVYKFKNYVGSLKKPNRPTFYFIHSILPHMPFQFMPSLRRYRPDSVYGYPTNRWTTNTATIQAAYHQYLLQTGAADTLLGKLMQRLKEIGVYDRAFIIVTADHGVSFKPGDYRRGVFGTPNFVEDILYVPLFMKLPEQSTGVVDYRNVQSIDILPTVADVLDLNMSWPVDGKSVFDESVSLDSEKKAFISRSPSDRHPSPFWPKSGGFIYVYETPLSPPRETLDWKLSLPAYIAPSSADYFYLGPYDDLIGKEAASMTVLDATAFAFKLRRGLDLSADRKSLVLKKNSGVCPCRLLGDVFSPTGAEFPSNTVAIGVNDKLWGFAQIRDINGHPGYKHFDITISEAAFRVGANSVQVFLVEGSGTEDLRLIKAIQRAS